MKVGTDNGRVAKRIAEFPPLTLAARHQDWVAHPLRVGPACRGQARVRFWTLPVLQWTQSSGVFRFAEAETGTLSVFPCFDPPIEYCRSTIKISFDIWLIPCYSFPCTSPANPPFLTHLNPLESALPDALRVLTEITRNRSPVTPLQSGLPVFSSTTPLESALPQKRGGGIYRIKPAPGSSNQIPLSFMLVNSTRQHLTP